ncbi:MAG: hypothetical protein WDN76_13620 [Alphaproteobacteria bacterium]
MRINSELGDMQGAALSPVPLLHFQRMDALLDRIALQDLQLTYGEQDLRTMRELASDDAATLARLHEIGLRSGEAYFAQEPNAPKRNWERAIFPKRFDPPGFGNRVAGPRSPNWRRWGGPGTKRTDARLSRGQRPRLSSAGARERAQGERRGRWVFSTQF